MARLATITVQCVVKAPIEKVWEVWTKPEHIVHWAFPSDDWEAPAAENDLHVGGKFKTAMAAEDKSMGFDFTGVYTSVKEHELIEYDIDDGRHVKVEFTGLPEGVKITCSVWLSVNRSRMYSACRMPTSFCVGGFVFFTFHPFSRAFYLQRLPITHC